MKSFNALWRAHRALLLAAGILVLAAATALATAPVRGAKYTGLIKRYYHGTLLTTFPISFNVSKNGKKVSDFVFKAAYPIYCQGGGFGSPRSRSAAVSSKGTFKVKLPLIFAPAHNQNQGNLIVTGTFRKHGNVTGTVTTAFRSAKVCNGSSKYSAHG
jgi:hypothetical protein